MSSPTSSAMQTVNIYEAKTQFSKLVHLASSGCDIVIAQAMSEPLYPLTSDSRMKRHFKLVIHVQRAVVLSEIC